MHRRAEQLEHQLLLAADSGVGSFSGFETNLTSVEFRSIDGTDNNPVDDEQGAADTRVIRFGYPAVHPDGHDNHSVKT